MSSTTFLTTKSGQIDIITSALDTPPELPPHHTISSSDEISIMPPLENDKDQALRPKTAQWGFFIVIASLFFGTFLVALDTTIIGTAIPAISTAFHALNDIGWFGSGYLLTLTALQPSFGKLFTMWDVKTIYLLCVLVFEGKFSSFTIPLYGLF